MTRMDRQTDRQTDDQTYMLDSRDAIASKKEWWPKLMCIVDCK